MSNLVFPSTIRGLQPEITRTPMFSTILKTSASGKEVRSNLMSFPRWKWSLNYGYLKDYSGNNQPQIVTSDYRQLVGFFNQVKGDFDSFLFSDPDDNGAYNNGNTPTNIQALCTPLAAAPLQQFQINRGYGNYLERIQSPNTPFINFGGLHGTVIGYGNIAVRVKRTTNTTAASNRAIALVNAGTGDEGTFVVADALDALGNPTNTVTFVIDQTFGGSFMTWSGNAGAPSAGVYGYDPNSGIFHFNGADLGKSVTIVTTQQIQQGSTGLYLQNATSSGLDANTGILYFNSALGATDIVSTWCLFYFRVRFANPEMDFDAFMNMLYSGTIELIQVVV